MCLIALYGRLGGEERETAQESKGNITKWAHLGKGKREEENKKREEDEQKYETVCIYSTLHIMIDISRIKDTQFRFEKEVTYIQRY